MVLKLTFVGLMGSGKSTLGRQLASQAFFSHSFVDLDEEIVARYGKPIPEIFAEKGESYFRQLESEALEELLNSDKDHIIATGGGAVLSEQNRLLMKEKSTVIWLDASAEVLAARVSGDSNRPLIQGVDPLTKMKELTEQRNGFYQEVADIRIETDKCSDEEAVALIVDYLTEYGHGQND